MTCIDVVCMWDCCKLGYIIFTDLLTNMTNMTITNLEGFLEQVYMKMAWSLKYGVWYSIYSVVVKYNKVKVMVGQNQYSKF